MAFSKPSRRSRQFAALQPRTLAISQAAIKKKWTKLPETSQLRVKQLFRSVERSIQHKDGRAAIEVQSVVDDVANMLTRKLPRMPFPPKTEEIFFDYETVLNSARVLEAQLTTDLHSTSLLKAEIEKDRRLLEEDKKELRQLEKALKDEEVRRKRHNRGLHPLAKIEEEDAVRPGTIEETPRLPSNIRPPLQDLDNDAGLEDLLKQLHSHLESLQNNTNDIQEIPSAMTTARAALDSFSWQFLEKEKYSKLHGLELT